MAEFEKKGKVKDFKTSSCEYYKDGFCIKVKKRCKNNTGFYTECTIIKGNQFLNGFF